VLNLFLALLINAFASDNLKSAGEKEEENKMKMAFLRIKELCCCCLSKKGRSVGPKMYYKYVYILVQIFY
jgi:hypothetical protein